MISSSVLICLVNCLVCDFDVFVFWILSLHFYNSWYNGNWHTQDVGYIVSNASRDRPYGTYSGYFFLNCYPFIPTPCHYYKGIIASYCSAITQREIWQWLTHMDNLVQMHRLSLRLCYFLSFLYSLFLLSIYFFEICLVPFRIPSYNI